MKKLVNLYKDAFSGLSRDIWLLTLVTLINRSGTMVVPFIAIYLMEELSFSYIQTGIVMSFFGVGSVVGSYIGGILTDTFGHYRTMFWSLLLGGCALLNLLFINSFEMWCFGVFMVTAVGDSFRPASMAAVGFYSKEENRTRSLGLVRLAVNLGFGIGPAFGGILAASFGYDWLFIIDGMTCILAAFMFLVILKDKHRPQKVKKTSLTISNDTKENSIPPSPYKDNWFLAFVFFCFLNSIVFIQFMGTLPIYYKEGLSFSDTEVGLLIAMNGFIITLVEMPLIFVLEKRNNILSMIAMGVFLTGLCYELLTWTSWAGIAIISMLCLTFGEIINFPFAASFSLNRAAEENRGAYMGLYGLSFSVGHIIAPILGMKVVEIYGYDTLWHGLGILALVSVAGVLFVQKGMKKVRVV
ncbi:MAG: MFS family permease [Saprospiraceae bacterium]|jgi:MFS family permease